MAVVIYDDPSVTYDDEFVQYNGTLLSSSGTVSAVTSETGKVSGAYKTTGSDVVTTAATGRIWILWSASSTNASVATPSGNATVIHAVSGVDNATSETSGRVTSLFRTSGTSAATTGVTGNTWESVAVSGTVAATSAVSARVVVPRGVFVVSASSGAASLAVGLSGTVVATSGTALTVGVSLLVSGSTGSDSGSTGKITSTSLAFGTVSGTTSASGSVHIIYGGARGSAAVVSLASTNVTADLVVSGQAGAASRTYLFTTNKLFVRGTVTGVVAPRAHVVVNHVISGTVPVVTSLVGRIGQIQRVSGSTHVVSGASGNAARSGPISGIVRAITSASATVTTTSTNRPVVANTILYDLDPDKIVGVVNGAAVSSIPETVDDRDAVASTGHQGTYVVADADFNGKPAVSLDGAADYYVVPALATSAASWAVALVIKPGSTASGEYYFDGVLGQSSAIYTDAANGSGYSWMPATSRGDFGSRSTAAQIMVVQFAAGNSYGVQNGGTKGLDSAATVTPFGAFTLGASSALSGFAQVDVARVLVYSGTVSDQDLINIDSWARGRYGIEVADFNTVALNALPIDVTFDAQAWISTDSHQRFASPHGAKPVAGRATAGLVLTAATPVIYLGVPKLPAYSMIFPITITDIEGSSHIRTIADPDPVWDSGTSEWITPPGFSGVGDIRWSLQTLIDPTSFGDGVYPLGDRSANDGTDLIGDGATQWSADASTGGPAWHSAYPFKPTVSTRDDLVSGGQTVHQDKGVLITSGSDAHMWLDMGTAKPQPFTWVIVAMPLRYSSSSQAILDSGQDPYDSGFPQLTPGQLANDIPIADNLPYRTNLSITAATAAMHTAPGESGISTSVSYGTRPKMFCTVFNGTSSTLYVRDTNGTSSANGSVSDAAGYDHRYYVLGREYGWASPTKGCEMMVFEIRFFDSALDDASMADQYAQLSSTFQFDRYR